MKAEKLLNTLEAMKENYEADPVGAVRSQSFIKLFHNLIADELEQRLTSSAKKRGIRVEQEAKIFGSYKAKDVDVSVIDPINGPLMLIGVRSQMSSVAKNALTYYQDIVGEAISLQERFPMCVTGYAYIHPKYAWSKDSSSVSGQWADKEKINHKRYARMYASISGRDDRLYKHQIGSYDHFAYSVIDFTDDPVSLDEEIVANSLSSEGVDLSIYTFIDRLIETFLKRNVWMEDIFTFPASEPEDIIEESGLEDLED